MEEVNATSWKYRIKTFFGECIRVFRITKKPSIDEYKTIVKVSGLGILIIGALGFIVAMVRLLFF